MEKKNKLSIVVIDSRSKDHPDWVDICIDSITKQIEEAEIIVINNTDRKRTIGKCWNDGVSLASGDWVLFVGDDDWIARDLTQVLSNFIDDISNDKIVCATTWMTAFQDNTNDAMAIARQWTGCWRKSYLEKYPFNEELKSGIDREYVDKTTQRGDLHLVIPYYYGYYYRKHNDYSCAGEITFVKEPSDYYFVTGNRTFLTPITERFQAEGNKVFIDNKFTRRLAEEAKVIWQEWAHATTCDVGRSKVNAKKILRIHSHEAYTEIMKYIDFKWFDNTVFINENTRNFVESTYGKIKGSLVIPNGVDLNRFKLHNHEINNKIAYAGYITRKKGCQLLFLLAESFPAYEFHVCGKFQEDDMAYWFNNCKPDNMFLHNWDYSIENFYKDKTYLLNTSTRESQAMTVMEGMAMGLKPLVYNWMSAKDIYGKHVYSTMDQFKDLLEETPVPEEYRSFVEQNYNFEDTYKSIRSLLV